MSFTDEEKERWHRERRQRETIHPPVTLPPVAECTHCGQPFSAAEGHAFGAFPICDACDKD